MFDGFFCMFFIVFFCIGDLFFSKFIECRFNYSIVVNFKRIGVDICFIVCRRGIRFEKFFEVLYFVDFNCFGCIDLLDVSFWFFEVFVGECIMYFGNMIGNGVFGEGCVSNRVGSFE